MVLLAIQICAFGVWRLLFVTRREAVGGTRPVGYAPSCARWYGKSSTTSLSQADSAHRRLYVCMYVCMYVCLSVCLSVCLPACLPVCLSACLPSCLPAKDAPAKGVFHRRPRRESVKSKGVSTAALVGIWQVKRSHAQSLLFARVFFFVYAWSGCRKIERQTDRKWRNKRQAHPATKCLSVAVTPFGLSNPRKGGRWMRVPVITPFDLSNLLLAVSSRASSRGQRPRFRTVTLTLDRGGV
jgi:hypothetical protein